MKQHTCAAFLMTVAVAIVGCANPLTPVTETEISGGPSDGYTTCAELVGRALDLSIGCPGTCEQPYPYQTPVRLQYAEQFRAGAGWTVTKVVLRIGDETYRSVADPANDSNVDHFSFVLSARPRALSPSFTRARVYVHWNHHPDGPGQPGTSLRWAEGSSILVAQSASGGPETLTLSAYVDTEVPSCSS